MSFASSLHSEKLYLCFLHPQDSKLASFAHVVQVVQVQGPVDSDVRLSSSAAAGLSPNAVAAPCLEHGQSFAAALELTKDAAGGELQFEVECRWTAADGRRMRQVRLLLL